MGEDSSIRSPWGWMERQSGKPWESTSAALGEPPGKDPFRDQKKKSSSWGCDCLSRLNLLCWPGGWSPSAGQKADRETEDSVTKWIKHKTCAKWTVWLLSHQGRGFRAEAHGVVRCRQMAGAGRAQRWDAFLHRTGFIPPAAWQGLPSFPASFVRWVWWLWTCSHAICKVK